MRTDYINPDTMWRIISFLRPQNALVMRVCLETGIRVGDVVKLPTDALRGASIHYTAQKTGKKGKASISTELMRALMRNCDGDFLFPSTRSKTGHISRQTVWSDVKRVAHRTGVRGNIAPHSARKTFAVEKLKTDGLGEVQKLLQHGDIGTTLLYCLSDSSFFENGDKLDEILDNTRTIVLVVRGIESKFAEFVEMLHNPQI